MGLRPLCSTSRLSRKNSLRTLAGYGFIPPVKTGGGGISSRQRACCGTLWLNGTVNRRRMQVYYSGSVQGVGFRYTARTVATGFELTGAVRNLPDGRVELVAEGIKEELEAFRQAIRDSGLEHFIQKEEVIWSDVQNGFRGFEIVR